MVRKWKPLELKTGGLQIRGGESRRWWSLETCVCDGKTFVRLNMSDEWVTHVVIGKSRRSHPLGHPSVLRCVNDQVDAAVASSTKENPMGAMDAGLGVDNPRDSGGQQIRSGTSDMTIVVTLATTAEHDSDSHKISVLSKGADRKKQSKASSAQVLWIAQEDLHKVLERMSDDEKEHSSDLELSPTSDKLAQPSLEYSPATRAWTLRHTDGDGMQLDTTKSVQTHKRRYPEGRKANCVREVVPPDVFESNKRAALRSLVGEAVQGGFKPTSSFLAAHGLQVKDVSSYVNNTLSAR